MKFNKTHLDLDDQLKILSDRGLIVEDINLAKAYLSNISYFRLSAYTLPFQINNPVKDHNFKPGTTFNNVIGLYAFDRSLRLLVFDLIERVEVALRTQISYHYSLNNGGWWYEDPNHFNNNYHYSRQLAKIDGELDRSGEVFISHYKNKYSSPKRPPSWIVFEVISMGLLSKIFRNLKMSQAKKDVARHFDLPTPYILESWMHSLTYVRNICAHHGRLWNRVLTVKPKIPDNIHGDWLNDRSFEHNKLYAFLCCSFYVLKTIIPDTSFVSRFQKLLNDYPEIDISKMGFINNWNDEPLWAE